MVEMDILRGQRLDRRRKNNKLHAVLASMNCCLHTTTSIL
jgi:hypothetical protein